MKPFLTLATLLSFTLHLTAQAYRGRVQVPPRPPFADSLPDATHASIRFTVVDAEADGAQWVQRTETTFQPADHGAERFAVPVARTCVSTTSGTEMYSGEFVIGGDVIGPGSGREVKIWWTPKHPAQSFSLVVRGARLGSPTDTLRYTNTGWAIGGSPQAGTLGPIFYASGIAFPSAGRWLLIATSGPDWGCFIVTSR